MRDGDYIRTIQSLQAENQKLRGQLGQKNAVNFEQKYMKALREISAIMNANKQFRQELIKLREERTIQIDNYCRIQKEQFNKAHQKLLEEKNELYGQKQNLELENSKLKYAVNSLEDNIAKLKTQKIDLAQQKESLRILSPKSEKERRGQENNDEKYVSLNKVIHKIEDEKRNLENKVYELESEYSNQINEKQMQLRQTKATLKEQYESQINEMRRQISKLKITNNQLSIKAKNNFQDEKQNQGNNEYEKQLIQTLRDVRAQMEPMRFHIAELQERNQFEKEQTEREKAQLQIKVVELASEISRLKEIQKMHEGRQIRESQKNRRLQEAEKTIKKLEQQNRMLGGRLIVLQSKEIALRNRNGNQLEQRVLEFQNRVEMLLSDKETVANMKNVSIHQLIALKAYILELDAKLKQLVHENQYAVKKYKNYKEKCGQLIKELKQHDIAINSLKGKLHGYDHLVVKLQGEFERAISISDKQIKSMNIKIAEQSAISIEVYKKRYQSLLQKLNLQQKYSQQQLQTLKLNYETKIVELNLKLQEMGSIRETLGLYKVKNDELTNKLTQKENQLLESRINKNPSLDLPQMKANNQKQTIRKLNETINSKQATILNLENQIKKVESDWKSKLSQMEQIIAVSHNKKSVIVKEKDQQIERLEAEIKEYRNKINTLQTEILKYEKNSNEVAKPDVQYIQYQQIVHKKVQLQTDLDQLRNKYESQALKTHKLTKNLNEAKKNSQELQSQLTRMRYQIKNMESEMNMELEEKNNEIKRLKIRTNQADNTMSRVDVSESLKISSLKIEIQNLEGRIQILENDKQRYYSKNLQLERNNVELGDQIERMRYQLSKAKSANNEELVNLRNQKQLEIQSLQYSVRTLKEKVKAYQQKENQFDDDVNRLRGQWNRQKNRMIQDLDYKDEQYSKIVRQLNKMRSQLNNQNDIVMNIQNQYQFKISRYNTELKGLREEVENNQHQIQRYEKQIRRYRDRQDQFNSKISELQIQLENGNREYKKVNTELIDEIEQYKNVAMKLEQEVKYYQQRQGEYERGFEDRKNYASNLGEKINSLEQREGELEKLLLEKDSQNFRLNSELNNIRNNLHILQNNLQSNDSYTTKLNQQINNLRIEMSQIEKQKQLKQGIVSRLSSQLDSTKNMLIQVEEELIQAQKQTNKWKYQKTLNDEQSLNIQSQLQEKDGIIARLQQDIRNKSQYINQLAEEIQTKTIKISELQTEGIRLRGIAAEYETELMEKNAQLGRTTFQLNAQKNRLIQLEQQLQHRQNQWQIVNRQVVTIKTNLQQCQQDLFIKDSQLERYKKDNKQLNQGVEALNTQIYQKTKQINQLSQEVFKFKLESEEKQANTAYKTESQLIHFKTRISSLENQLENKQFELGKVELEINNLRANIQSNKYSDEEYDMLQAQYFQLQSSLNTANRQLSERQLEIEEMNSKFEYQKRFERDLKKQFEQEKQFFEDQIENILKRQRKLKVEYEALQNEYEYKQTQKDERKQQSQFGLELYSIQVDRLNGVVEELNNQINGLKLKLANMVNQQDRIIENMTLMTLTFAEVESLRARMVDKQNQISEVRRNLINYVSSTEELSMNSKKILMMNQQFKSSKFLTQDNLNKYETEEYMESKKYLKDFKEMKLAETFNDGNFMMKTKEEEQFKEDANINMDFNESDNNVFGARNVISYGDQGFLKGPSQNDSREDQRESRNEQFQSKNYQSGNHSENSSNFHRLQRQASQQLKKQNQIIQKIQSKTIINQGEGNIGPIQGYSQSPAIFQKNHRQVSLGHYQGEIHAPQRMGQMNVIFGNSPNQSLNSSRRGNIRGQSQGTYQTQQYPQQNIKIQSPIMASPVPSGMQIPHRGLMLQQQTTPPNQIKFGQLPQQSYYAR